MPLSSVVALPLLLVCQSPDRRQADLYSKDEAVAFQAACEVFERSLDLEDIDRYVELTMPRLFDESLEFDFQTFKHVLNSDQVAHVLNTSPPWNADVRSFFISDLHRSMRPQHIPSLCQRIHDDDPIVREKAFGVLGSLSAYTDQHREAIALALLSWPGKSAFVLPDYGDPTTNPPYQPLKIELPAVTGGFPPLLRATLERWFVPDEQDTKHGGPFDTWLARWAISESPGPDDVELLIRLLDSRRQAAQWIALRGLRAYSDQDRVAGALLAYQSAEDRSELDRAAALAARGVLDELRALAIDDAAALFAAFDLGDRPAFDAWCERAFGRDAAIGLAAIEALENVCDYDRFSSALLLPAGFYESLRIAVETQAEQLDAARIELLASEVTSCRTPALAAAAFACLDPERPAVLPLLEVFDEPRLTSALEAWLGSEGVAREVACEHLARLGVSRHATALIEWAGGDVDRLTLLARCGDSSEVVSYLVERARGAKGDYRPLAALAIARGLPDGTAHEWAHRIVEHAKETSDEWFDRWCTELADGDAVADVFVEYLQRADDDRPLYAGLGSIDDPRIRAYLRQLWAIGTPDVQNVIGELAVAGDRDAIATLAEVRARGLYGWMDDGNRPTLTLGQTLDLLPYWVGEVETICCRRNAAAGVLDDLVGFDVHAMSERGLRTQYAYAAAWWQRNGEHLRFSKIADRFVVAPH